MAKKDQEITKDSHAVLVTPDVAADWLDKNTRNRTINNARVRQYARSMKNGEWKFTGEAIKFAKSGKLLDGQHRLWACVESGVPFKVAVVTELAEDVMPCLDTGMPRTRGSVLKINEERHPRILGAALTWLWKLRRGRRAILKRAEGPTNQELLSLLKEVPELRGDVDWLHRFGSAGRVVGRTGQMAALLSIVRKDYPAQAEQFFTQLFTGANCVTGSPALALRNRLSHARVLRQRINQDYLVTLFAYAWKAHVEGKTLSKLSPRKDLPNILGGPDWDNMP